MRDKPVETLPALRNALFVQKLDELSYSFNPPVERMLEEVRDLRALISRMPTTGFVNLSFFVVDIHFMSSQPQVLDPEVWKKEFQGLLDIILEKGCSQLYVWGGAELIKFYSKHVEFPHAEGKVLFLFCPTAVWFLELMSRQSLSQTSALDAGNGENERLY